MGSGFEAAVRPRPSIVLWRIVLVHHGNGIEEFILRVLNMDGDRL
jgi:hypothetical protein